jgi:hypothetical protein
LPLPDSPVKTTIESRGIARSMSCRLCTRAPWTLIWACAADERIGVVLVGAALFEVTDPSYVATAEYSNMCTSDSADFAAGALPSQVAFGYY